MLRRMISRAIEEFKYFYIALISAIVLDLMRFLDLSKAQNYHTESIGRIFFLFTATIIMPLVIGSSSKLDDITFHIFKILMSPVSGTSAYFYLYKIKGISPIYIFIAPTLIFIPSSYNYMKTIQRKRQGIM